MQIQKIKLEHFRNYTNFELEFKKKVLLIKGKNAQGKTNLIEALFALSIGKSFRLKNLSEAIEWEQDYMRINGILSDKTDLELFYSTYPRKQKVSKINKVKKKLNDFVGNFLSVLFTPEDIDLISAAPGLRRRFLDILLSQVSHNYLVNLLTYQKILKQRNKLLKAVLEKKSQENELDFWDMKLAEHGTEVIKERRLFFKTIEEFLKKQYQNISGKKDRLELSYLAKIKNLEKYSAKLISHRKRDILMTETSLGPHRDDFEFILNDKPINSFGSRGEYRSSILALKLSEVNFIESQTGKKPILLLDDVFSELDSERQKYLLEAIQNQQTVITTTDDNVLNSNTENVQVLEV